VLKHQLCAFVQKSYKKILLTLRSLNPVSSSKPVSGVPARRGMRHAGRHPGSMKSLLGSPFRGIDLKPDTALMISLSTPYSIRDNLATTIRVLESKRELDKCFATPMM